MYAFRENGWSYALAVRYRSLFHSSSGFRSYGEQVSILIVCVGDVQDDDGDDDDPFYNHVYPTARGTVSTSSTFRPLPLAGRTECGDGPWGNQPFRCTLKNPG